MVLTRALSFVALAAVVVAAGTAELARAQSRNQAIRGIFKYRVENPSCSLRVKQGGSWQVYRGAKLRKGSVVIGKPSARAPDLVVFRSRQVPRAILAGRKSCLFEKGSPEELNLGEKFKIQATFAIVSWQESLKLKLAGATTSTRLRATQLTVCPGASVLRVRDGYEYGVNGCAFYGKSQAGRSAPVNVETGDTSKYAVKNVDVFGAAFTGKYLWRPDSGNVAFGANLPVMFRYGNWPVRADTDAAIGPKFWFLIGLSLEARLERGSFYFSQRVGFLNIPKSLNWALEGGYTF